MVKRFSRLTPGYFRLLQLQTQSAQELACGHAETRTNRAALLLSLLGLALSSYSLKRMRALQLTSEE
ncbi:unnamed protein product [Lampetra planeri]